MTANADARSPEPTRGARPGFTPETVLWLCGGVYVGALVVFFLLGDRLFARYLTYPGGLLAFGFADLAPAGTAQEAFVTSAGGNIVLLILGASVNVISAYLLLRLLLVWTFTERRRGPRAAIDRRPRRAWWKPPRWAWLTGALYVAWLANLTLDGEGIGAAYLTFPVGVWLFALSGPLFDRMPGGDVALVMIAGAVNIAVLFVACSGLYRLLIVRAFGETASDD